MNVLITGGYGFIGQHTAERFYKEDCTLTLIDKKKKKEAHDLKIKAASYTLDIEDKKCEALFKSGQFDTVIHLAVSKENASLDGFVNILNLAVKYGVKSFVFVSYHDIEEHSSHEMQRKMMEDCCINTSKNHWINCVGLRVRQVYGPKQHLSSEKSFVNEIIEKAIKGEVLESTFGAVDSLIYVNDVVDAIYKSVKHEISGIFDLEENRPPSWSPKYSFEEGLQKTIEWYKKDNGCHEEETVSMRSIRISKVLPYLENVVFFLIVFLIHYKTRENLNRYSVFPMDLNIIYIFVISIIYGMNQGIIAALLASFSYFFVYLNVSPDIVGILYNKGHIVQLLLYLIVAIVASFAIDNKKREISHLKGNFKMMEDDFTFLKKVHEDTVQVKNELSAQILSSDNSLGTVYSLSKELNSLLIEDIFNGAVNTLERLMKTKAVSIYTLSPNKSFLRLVAKSKKLNKDLNNSIDLEKNKKLKEVLLNKEIFVNRQFLPGLPIMTAPIVNNEEVTAVIFIHEMTFENLNLYIENFFKVSIQLISSSFSQALSYEKAIKGDKFIVGTRVMYFDYFKQVIESKNKAKEWFDIDYTILKLASKHQQENLKELSRTIERSIRETDYMGIDSHNKLHIVLSNSNYAMSTAVIERLEISGVSVKISDRVEA